MEYSRHKKIHDVGSTIAIVLSILFFTFIVVKDYISFHARVRTAKAIAIDSLSQKLDGTARQMTDTYRQASRDMLFLSRTLDASSTNTQIFHEAINQTRMYLGLEILGENGEVQYRSGDFPQGFALSPDFLQKSLALKQNQIFLYVTSTQTNDQALYALASLKGYRGLVVAAVDSDYIFADIKQNQRYEESVYLIDEHGRSLLAGAEMPHSGVSMLADRVHQSNQERGMIEIGDSVFYFKRMYPALASHELYQGAQKIHGENYDLASDYWILAVSVEKAQLYHAVNDAEKDFFLAILLSVFIAVSVAAAQLVARRSFALAGKHPKRPL